MSQSLKKSIKIKQTNKQTTTKQTKTAKTYNIPYFTSQVEKI